MLLFADCGNIKQLKEMEELGILSGITTNPVILSRESSPPVETIAKICQAFPEIPVFAQTNALICDDIVEGAVAYAKISPKLVIKIPACAEGFKAFRKIRKEKLFENHVCITTVTTAAQALLASAAGAEYVAPYLGDIDQIGYSGMDVLLSMAKALAGTNTKIIACAAERAQDMVKAAQAGAYAATITPGAARAALEKPYPITEWYLKLFLDSAQK